jgi:hypothetical protein
MKKLVAAMALAAAFACSAFAKDVYVRAGASGGDGSKEKPYPDISVALAMGVYAGDVIHVAQGVYYGEGAVGKWVIKTPDVAIVGGYSTDFSARDPFKYRSILARGLSGELVAEAKKRGHDVEWGLSLVPTKASYNGGPLVTIEGDVKNVIVDGFVIDGYTRLTYKPSGDLRIDVGPIGSPLVSFNKPGCKLLNCVLVNSGGPGVQMIAAGNKDDPASWNEVSNCVIVNTLMSGIDFRVGTWDPDRSPDSGYAVAKNNTIVFVWSHLGEGYGILVGRQTRLLVQDNVIAFCTDYAIQNGFGNDKMSLVGNVFFNNIGGVYRYFDKDGSKATIVMDDPTQLSGRNAKKLYYLSDKSAGNVTADPGLTPDPVFFEKFSNQIKSEGGGKVVWDEVNQWRAAMGLPLVGTTGTGNVNYAPIYEQKYVALFSPSVAAGAKAAGPFAAYASKAAERIAKTYADIKYADLKANLGKDVRVRVKLARNPDPTSFYVASATKEEYVCYRSEDMQHFFYFKKGSEELEIAQECIADGEYMFVSGTLYDIKDTIKMTGKYGFVVDLVEYDD